MGTITYQIPVAGSTLNSVADPQISTALQTLLTLVNGNIDTNNLSPTANIAASQLKTVFPSGLLSARPAAASAGQTFYYATDTGFLYWSNGTAWTTVASPAGVGAWQALTLPGIVSALSGAYAPAARLEGTDVVRLRGTIQAGGTLGSGTTLFTIPSALRQTQSTGLQLTVSYGTGPVVGTLLQASTTGVCTLNATFPNGTLMFLDGLTYSL